MAAGFAVHHNVEMFYPFWMAVAGTVILFSGGLVGHVGKQMEKSSSRFSLSNIIFYVLALSSAGLFFTAAGLDTFGDSSNYCTVPDLKLCVPYEPVTRMGLFKVCEGDLVEGAVENEKCSTWDNVNPEKTENFQWAVSFIFAMYLLAGCAMIASFIVKLLWDSLRGIATSFTVFALGAAITAQCLMSTLVTSYYHRYDEVYNELRYDAQFYGSAYYISLAGLITTAITLASILGEESSNNDYMSNKKSAIYDASNFDSSRTTQVKDEKVETLN